MNTEIDKNIKSPFAVRTVKNVIQMYTTLSDRLKQAGIKENTPKCPVKGNKHKNARRNKKNQKVYSKSCMSSSFQRTKKFRKPLKHFVTPYTDKSAQNEIPQAEILSKRFEPVPDNIPETEESADKETIFVSLDFIEDCQNYKKKVRKQISHRRKSLRSVASHPKGNLDRTESSRKSIESNANPWEDRECGDQQEGNSNEALINAAEKELSEALECVKPLLNQLSSEDIAKIDKKYLDSILIFTTKHDTKKKEDEGESKLMEVHSEAKKKLTGRDFFELKHKTKECQEVLRKSSSSIEGQQTERKDNLDSPYTEARIVRDLTKSEEQIKLKKGKNLFDHYDNKFKMETKNVTHSKPDINDVSRKKRKPRNKFIQSKAKEFVETSLPSEMSRVADVKELWRRKTLIKKSENSLTSHSSCTVPEIDDYPLSKNLESYKILKKLVEEEIANISKKSENKNNTEEVKTKENNPKKQSELTKKPPLGKRTELPILKGRLLQAKEKIEKPELLNLLGEDVPKEANPKLVSAEEKVKNGKLPRKIIENWSILNRLEQAFLGLGTPTFPEKNEKTNLKSKNLNRNEECLTEKLMKDTKKVQKYRDVLAKREHKGPSIQKNAPKTLKKTESGIKKDAPKEGTTVKPKKNGKGEAAQPPEPNTPKPEETSPKQKKKLRHSPDRSSPEKPSISSGTRRRGKELTDFQTRLCIKGKYQNMAKKEAANLKKGFEDSLERKKTFDVIPALEESKIQPRRSKSCGINDTSLEGRMRMQDSDVFSKDGQKIRSKSIENDAKIVAATPKRLAKYPIKGATIYELSQVNDNLKSVGEKECFKENRETTLKCRGVQEKVVKNFKITEEPSKDLLPGSVVYTSEKDKRNNNCDNKKGIEDNNNNTLTERAVKKRSILSVNTNQHSEQATRKLLQIKEKESSASSLENVYRTSEKEFKSSYSNTSFMSTGTVEGVETKESGAGLAWPKQQGKMETSQTSTTSAISNPNFEDNAENGIECSEWRRRQRLWEQDMDHYRAIVKEIMNQYERTNGFLKQNEQLNNFTNNTIALSAASDDISKSENYSQLLDIEEYRKKIITEYNELPIFEYKSMMEQSKEGSCSESFRKRNLLVVRDFDRDLDVDVKDYEPKIQKILDSQLYVDKERLVRRTEPKRKYSEKISRLQDVVLRQNEGKATGEEWQRSTSMPGAFQPQRSYVILSNGQMAESQDHGIDNVTSESTTFYGPDTETESSPEISGF